MKKTNRLLYLCLTLTLTFASAPIPAPAATPPPPPPPTTTPSDKTAKAETKDQPEKPDPLANLKQEKERLALENSLAEEKLKQQLAHLTAEKSHLAAEIALAQERSRKAALEQQEEIARHKQTTELINQRLATAQAERTAAAAAATAAEIAELNRKREKLQAENALIAEQDETRQRAIKLETREIQLKLQQTQLALQQMQAERGTLEFEIAKLNSQLELRDKRDRLRNLVKHEITYTRTPFQNGILTISDRRIPLNGVIGMRTADTLQERIDYFNNQNPDHPIFIVIDSSPGGSVMAGYKILKAMEGSAAPVYTVVKSFAASMAAGITTLAKESYAYPNALILHHQILTYSYGNLTEQREGVRDLEEWWRRLATPIARKMGISLDEFIKQMYTNRSTGDWIVFGDKARELKWVDHIVTTIREESLDRNPDSVTRPAPGEDPRRHVGEQEKVDDSGRAYQLLPRLNPLDCYYLYNPDGYYRLTR
ncbi:MAG: ATP-dependent Clp protease proteolytic subunit [Opitutaceae bacterium]|jgi:ATP-dependent Clp protease protease subunit|nr:ATP-dependent Clp protease proteolytic subunit [Opitutaceae bacterium]